MKTLYAVVRTKGPAWDETKPMRSQEQWTEHAIFMDRLASEGQILLGGPLGDGTDILLIFKAAGESEVTSTLMDDPWSKSDILKVKSIQTWSVLLHSGEN